MSEYSHLLPIELFDDFGRFFFIHVNFLHFVLDAMDLLAVMIGGRFILQNVLVIVLGLIMMPAFVVWRIGSITSSGKTKGYGSIKTKRSRENQ